jgi:uridine kinase
VTRRLSRERLLADLGTLVVVLVAGLRPPHPLRVAVDGPDAAGKTTLADELAAALAATAPGRQVIRAGVDGFHRPAADRHRRGPLSPVGYLDDSFDHDALVASLLAPLGPGGDRRHRTAAFDHRADAPVTVPPARAVPDAVLLFDGVFLLRRELRPYWDLTVHLRVSPEETLRRALVRDRELFGGEAVTRRRYTARYLPGQRLYQERERPEDAADVLVDHDDPARPVVLRWPGG